MGELPNVWFWATRQFQLPTHPRRSTKRLRRLARRQPGGIANWPHYRPGRVADMGSVAPPTT